MVYAVIQLCHIKYSTMAQHLHIHMTAFLVDPIERITLDAAGTITKSLTTQLFSEVNGKSSKPNHDMNDKTTSIIALANGSTGSNIELTLHLKNMTHVA